MWRPPRDQNSPIACVHTPRRADSRLSPSPSVACAGGGSGGESSGGCGRIAPCSHLVAFPSPSGVPWVSVPRPVSQSQSETPNTSEDYGVGCAGFPPKRSAERYTPSTHGWPAPTSRGPNLARKKTAKPHASAPQSQNPVCDIGAGSRRLGWLSAGFSNLFLVAGAPQTGMRTETENRNRRSIAIFG